ncbi:glycoside hydrolase family 2 protein [Georgenia wutianyii]|uniref:beta-mannosidase n=1 Tax=Georgenia wutianyii TaxID=2585135 RepID=A0ABX5VNQ3_9MICO|nr:glycoside hydrolase family 2 protein [Georgenia wutianyii]QDB79833.1 glycoside hydrolase family 2 protein [Georgenia wutianyii]
MRTSTTLHDGWTVEATDGPVPADVAGRAVPATVPGSAHTDLLDAGLIPDPYLDENEAALAWAHHTTWRYRRELEAPSDAERVDLVFEGLDTLATITLDGAVIGRTANMHRSHRFDLTDRLTGCHELVVTFAPALAFATAEEDRLGERPHAFAHPFTMVRKMACSFGWDWGPDLQTAGMWRPVRLERWSTARLAEARPVVDLADDGEGVVRVHLAVERTAGGAEVPLTVEVRLATGQQAQARLAPGEDQAVVELRVPSAPVWWPAGHGDQPLVDLEVDLRAEEVIDTVRHRVGFRHVAVVTEPDEHGTSFVLTVNGRPIEVRGVNWIPDDHFLTRMDTGRYRARIEQARAANINLLRVWGGGVYESDEFYALCDELGMLVWQDFLLACAAYPEEEPLLGELTAEARENVARLAPHASLVVWCGGNENLWSRVDYWEDKLHGRTWGERYYTEIFPGTVAELSPATAYIAGSPYSPGAALDEVHPNDPDHGTMHIWDVWNEKDYTVYTDYVPRFNAEFGFQGPPSWTTLHRAVHDEVMTPTSPGVLSHQKAGEGQEKLARGWAGHFPEPRTFADWHWTTQLNQARAVAFGIEHFRSYWPRNTGSIVWQLNDCWPVTSWAAIDYDGHLKPLWYALRASYADRLLTVQPRDGRSTLAAVNGTDVPWAGRARLSRERFDGTVTWEGEVDVDVPARSTAVLDLPAGAVTPEQPTGEVLLVELDGVRGWHFFAEDVDLAYAPAPLEVRAESHPDGALVHVTALSLARDVTVLADRLAPGAVADDALVTLRSGEQVTVTVRAGGPVEVEGMDLAEVVRCANDLTYVVVDEEPEPDAVGAGGAPS